MSQVRTNSEGTTLEGSDLPRTSRGHAHRSNCAVEAALELIGGRWKGVVLYWLLVGGRQRFGAIRKRVPNCTERMLTLQLRELEQDGLISRTVYPEVPPRVEYELTALGNTLEPLLVNLREWGASYQRRVNPESASMLKPCDEPRKKNA